MLEKVREHYDYLCGRGYEVVFTALQGSQNYGLDEYSDEYYSDVDTKSVVLPKFEDFCAAKQPISAVEIMKDELGREVHAEVKDIRVMFEMFMKENISYIELLYSKWVVVNPKYQWVLDELVNIRDEIVCSNSKQFAKCIAGMAYEKQKALCHPYPSVAAKIEEFGYDGKQLSHVLRLWWFLTKWWVAGMDIEDCYWIDNKYMRKVLINLKKQKDPDGNALPCEKAVELMNLYVNSIKEMKDEIVNDSAIRTDGYAGNFLEQIKIAVLKQWFTEQLSISS